MRFFGATKLQQLTEPYRAADLFVMPSAGEGFGIAFLEAMINGTPVLGLDIAGARDALADGELVTAVSEAEFFVAIARLLVEPKPDPGALAGATRARFWSGYVWGRRRHRIDAADGGFLNLAVHAHR